MKKRIITKFLCVFSLLFIYLSSISAVRARDFLNSNVQTIHIQVLDSITGLPITDAYAVTDNGTFFSNQKGLIELQFELSVNYRKVLLKCMGYESMTFDFADSFPTDLKKIKMKPQNQLLEEVVVRGKAPLKSANKVGEKIGSKTFDESVGTSLTAMLEKVNGVSSIRTGTTVSKPVIQGMSGHRILLVNNGAKLTGQQWGADHAPEVDMNSFHDITVIKGSDAVKYGSDALGGVVIMNAAPLPYQGRSLSGRTTLSYGTNGRKGMMSTTLEGALPFLKDMAWRLQGTYSNGGDRLTANYVLNNTGTREYNVSANLGYRHGCLNVDGGYNRYFDKLGILLSAQMGSEDMLKERIKLGRPIYVEPYSRRIRVPFQEVTHQTGILKASYDFETIGRLEWQGTWQQNDREEFNNRRLDSSVPTVSLHLKSFQNKLQWMKLLKDWNFNAGGSINHQENHSQSGTGFVPVIPNYTETQIGFYGLVKFQKTNYGFEGGIRFDSQRTKAKGYDWTGNMYGGERNFQNVTYSLGGHYSLSDKWKLISNFGAAWRAPHVFELYSNGNDLASGMFVRGDSQMNSEKSYKWITSIAYRHNWISAKLDGFLQWIDGYIYDQPTKETISVISGTYPVFRFRQTPAFFRGLDLEVVIKPLEYLNFHLVGSYIAAEEKRTGNYLPYIPSLRFRQELCFKKNWKKVNFSTTVIHKYVAKQKKFNPQADLISFTPPAYHLFDLHAQLTFDFLNGRCLKLIVSAENIFNKEYKEYTNRSRYYAHDLGRDIRLAATWTY